MSKSLSCLIVAVNFFCCTGYSAADVVEFDNGPPLIAAGAGSDVASDARLPVQVADNFSLSPGANPISKLRWWGVYDSLNAPGADDFTVEFLQGTTINSSSVLSTYPSISVSRTNTGFTNPVFDIYEFEATISPLVFAPSTNYWMTIYNSTPSTGGFWFFSKSVNAPAGDIFLRSPIGSGSWIVAGPADQGELAFQLISVPEPSSFLAFAGIAGLAVFRRRSRHCQLA